MLKNIGITGNSVLWLDTNNDFLMHHVILDNIFVDEEMYIFTVFNDNGYLGECFERSYGYERICIKNEENNKKGDKNGKRS